jgi:uncharacterized protein (TIGR00369 family)
VSNAVPTGAGPYGELLGARVTRKGEDEVEIELSVAPHHVNSFGVVHGGVLMALLDMALGHTVAVTLAPNETCTSVSMHTDFLAPGMRGTVRAHARLVRRGRTMAFPEGALHDEDGKLLARASGVWLIRARPAQ